MSLPGADDADFPAPRLAGAAVREGHVLEELERTHAIVRMLLEPTRRSAYAVQYVAELPVTLEPLTAATQLDTLLRSFSTPTA